MLRMTNKDVKLVLPIFLNKGVKWALLQETVGTRHNLSMSIKSMLVADEFKPISNRWELN